MSAPRNSANNSSHKHKAKRSLKRVSANESLHERGIVVDMSKPELDGIFAGLSTGELENPQEALNQVYALAIESVAQTLLDGLDDFCVQMVEQGQSADVQDNPIGAWIAQMLPRDPAKIAAFRKGLAAQIETMKTRVQASMAQGMAANSDLEKIVAAGRQTSDMVKDTLADARRMEMQLPMLERHVSYERLEEIYRSIQAPAPTDGVPRYHVTPLPGTYRFRMGTPVKVAKPETADENTTSEESSKDDAKAQDVEGCASEVQPPARADRLGLDGAFKDAASEVVSMVSDVTGMLETMAMGMAQTMIDAYVAQESAALPSLSEALKSDPRFVNDDALSAFVEALEADEDSDDEDEITNDELAGALDILLAGLDLED